MSSTATSKNRTALNQVLYLAARKVCKQPDNKQAVVWVREGACEEVTKRSRVSATNDYKELTTEEVYAVIRYLQHGPGTLDEITLIRGDSSVQYATASQLKKLHFLAQSCALHYAPCEGVWILDGAGNFEVTGEDLRHEIKSLFHKGKLRGAMSKHLYAKWINPKIHEFLKDAKLRYSVKMPTATYYVKWDEITREEANELIKRFQKIYNELTERYGAQSATSTHFSNN